MYSYSGATLSEEDSKKLFATIEEVFTYIKYHLDDRLRTLLASKSREELDFLFNKTFKVSRFINGCSNQIEVPMLVYAIWKRQYRYSRSPSWGHHASSHKMTAAFILLEHGADLRQIRLYELNQYTKNPKHSIPITAQEFEKLWEQYQAKRDGEAAAPIKPPRHVGAAYQDSTKCHDELASSGSDTAEDNQASARRRYQGYRVRPSC